jgi:hypothetical protein
VHPRTGASGEARPRRCDMPKKGTGSSIKKPKTYEALKDKGMSKERAAKISNAQANTSKSGKRKRK